MRPRLSLDRDHTVRGTKLLDWFFANRKWIRSAKLQVVECSWAERPLPEGEASIRFLVLATKRSYRRAHDRNHVKRWLRAAVTEIPEFVTLELSAKEREKQILIMMRISKPLPEVSWRMVVSDVERIAEYLSYRSMKGPTA
ncbi:MAG: ribonuclease P protein component [Bacteroidota bacterium]|nr:ribonuclease P protein component [Bacteroidota bacterium]MDP4287270.1 ribonuclease P protein component [Bacteroidota bacterium]